MGILYCTGFEMGGLFGKGPFLGADVDVPTRVRPRSFDLSWPQGPHTGAWWCFMENAVRWRIVPLSGIDVYIGIWTAFNNNHWIGTGFAIGAQTNNSLYTEIRWNPTLKHFDFYVNGVLTSSGSIVVPNQDTWVNLQLWLRFGAAGVGRCVTKVDGNDDIDFTGDTRPAGATSWNFAMIRNITAGGISNIIDDLIVRDDQFPGDIRVDGLKVSNPGAAAQWGTIPPGSFNYEVVKEVINNVGADDSDYVETSFGSFLDLYNIEDWDAADKAPVAVIHWTRGSKDSAGSQALRQVVRSGGANYATAKKITYTSPQYVYEIHDNDPNTAAEWTDSGIDNLQIGQRSVK